MIKTVTLETATALKEAGFKQESEFYWCLFQGQTILCYWETCIDKGLGEIICAAPTSDELLEEIPRPITILRYSGTYRLDCGIKNQIGPVNESLPEALVQMWLYLKKEGLLK